MSIAENSENLVRMGVAWLLNLKINEIMAPT